MTEQDYFKAYFGQQSDYYMEKALEYAGGKTLTFNVGAFFLGLFWFLYRKMYSWAITLFFAIIAFSFIEELAFAQFEISLGAQQAMSVCTNLAIASLMGFYGNKFYLQHASRDITLVLSQTEIVEERLKRLKQKGGVSIMAPLLGLVVVILWTLLSLSI